MLSSNKRSLFSPSMVTGFFGGTRLIKLLVKLEREITINCLELAKIEEFEVVVGQFLDMREMQGCKLGA